jgi:hypothetical protein
MALAASNLTSGSDTTDATSYATASITPTGNALVLLTVATRRAAGNPSAPTATGNGLTWVEVGTQLSSGSGNRRITILRAMGASPSTGAITINIAETQTECVWSVDQFTGTDTSGTNGSGAVVQSVETDDGGSTATSGLVTLAAFGSANNMAYGGKVHTSNGTTTPGSGFTELVDVAVAESGTGFQTEYKLNDTTVDWSWTGSHTWFAAALEIKEDVPAGGDSVPQCFSQYRRRQG